MLRSCNGSASPAAEVPGAGSTVTCEKLTRVEVAEWFDLEGWPPSDDPGKWHPMEMHNNPNPPREDERPLY
jgi:hypothetical protein